MNALLPALTLLLALPAAPQTRIADFTLPDTDGKRFSLYSLAGKKAAVLTFLGADCPVGKLYLPTLKRLAERYEGRGVAFVGIAANASESPAQVSQALREAGVTFRILHDPRQEVTRRLGATRTCETIVLDGTARVRYQGAIDDQYDFTARKPAPTKTFVVDALEAILAGKDVATAKTPTVGCLIERAASVAGEDELPVMPPDPPLPRAGKVTWARDVAPILQGKCESCHRPGQVAPFPLQTYAQAKRWAAMIAETTTTRRMPPWHADPHVGVFSNDRSLTPQERATLRAWAEQGAPQGDPKQAPRPKAYAEGWTLGQPDAVLTMPAALPIKADGTMPYQWVRIPTNFAEDRWIQAAEVRPGNRAVVHHVLAFVEEKGKFLARTNGLDGQLVAYVPGDVPTRFPAGIGKKLPAGADLLLQMHYTPIGKAATDQTAIGLYFSKEPPRQIAETVGVFQPRLAIPPGASAHKAERWFDVPGDVTILSLWPHMHLRGKAFSITAHFPDGKSEALLRVPRYDFNWQTRYELKTPRRLPKGTRLHLTAWFDNSKDNPANPDPGRMVIWGEQTADEMLIAYFDYVVDDPGTLGAMRRANWVGILRPTP